MPSHEDIERARAEIVRQANLTGGWMRLRWPGHEDLFVPRGAFENWALDMIGRQSTIEWKVVSCDGWKCGGDDPLHSDWMLGAGLQLDDWGDYFGELSADQQSLQAAAFDAAHAIQLAFRGVRLGGAYSLLVLGSEPPGEIRGAVVKPKPNAPVPAHSIVVLPDLRPHFVQALDGAAAVIAGAGGALAHLAVLAVERAVPIYYLAGVHSLLSEGSMVSIRDALLKIEDLEEEEEEEEGG
ncbi:MAG: PEP-utilizing enzyme [Patescibacteria group bacterium]|jgi:phosphohistidine swiveling domain-containing protein